MGLPRPGLKLAVLGKKNQVGKFQDSRLLLIRIKARHGSNLFSRSSKWKRQVGQREIFGSLRSNMEMGNHMWGHECKNHLNMVEMLI